MLKYLVLGACLLARDRLADPGDTAEEVALRTLTNPSLAPPPGFDTQIPAGVEVRGVAPGFEAAEAVRILARIAARLRAEGTVGFLDLPDQRAVTGLADQHQVGPIRQPLKQGTPVVRPPVLGRPDGGRGYRHGGAFRVQRAQPHRYPLPGAFIQPGQGKAGGFGWRIRADQPGKVHVPADGGDMLRRNGVGWQLQRIGEGGPFAGPVVARPFGDSRQHRPEGAF